MNPSRAAQRGRQLNNRLMVDLVEITRPGRPAINPNTGKETVTPAGVYLGPGRITTAQADERTIESAGATLHTEKSALQIPLGAAIVRIGDQVKIKEAKHNPTLQGRVFRIATIATETYATADKFTIEEVN